MCTKYTYELANRKEKQIQTPFSFSDFLGNPRENKPIYFIHMHTKEIVLSWLLMVMEGNSAFEDKLLGRSSRPSKLSTKPMIK